MTSAAAGAKVRRGRPRAGEQAARRQRVLEAAIDELVAVGYERLTMSGVAGRAGASKETLYRWFGSKDGLFAAMITANADAAVDRVEAALDAGRPPDQVLAGFAVGLLRLLTGAASVALNRAAMQSPDLAAVLLQNGRHRVGPIVESYLRGLDSRGHVSVPDPAQAFELLYGLIVRDTQIRVLLGEDPPGDDEIGRRASRSVAQFLLLHGHP